LLGKSFLFSPPIVGSLEIGSIVKQIHMVFVVICDTFTLFLISLGNFYTTGTKFSSIRKVYYNEHMIFLLAETRYRILILTAHLLPFETHAIQSLTTDPSNLRGGPDVSRLTRRMCQ
jgi:hypothetical protein